MTTLEKFNTLLKDYSVEDQERIYQYTVNHTLPKLLELPLNTEGCILLKDGTNNIVYAIGAFLHEDDVSITTISKNENTEEITVLSHTKIDLTYEPT